MSQAYKATIMRGRILLGRQPKVFDQNDPEAQRLATAPSRFDAPAALRPMRQPPQLPAAPTAPQPPAAPVAPAKPMIQQQIPNLPRFYPESGFQPRRYAPDVTRKPVPGVDNKPLSAAERVLQRRLAETNQGGGV